MVQINFALKEVNCKIVYYGPGMSGKTTNLEIVHRKAPTANKGDLTSIATEGDRTLFFDFMPLDLGNIAGMRTKFQLYTVPGQVYYNSTRKLVLQGVDGIIFVADSQADKMDENLESLENLRNNLKEYGKDVDQIPMVIQYNKRDMPTAMSLEDLQTQLNPQGHPHFEAIATTGEGVFPTLKALSAQVLENLSKEKRSAGAAPRKKVPVAAAAPAAAEEASAPTPTAQPAAPPAPAAPAAPAAPVPPAAVPPRPVAAPEAAPPALEPNRVQRPAASMPPTPAPAPTPAQAPAARPAPATPPPAAAPMPPRPEMSQPAAPTPTRKLSSRPKPPPKVTPGGGITGPAPSGEESVGRPERNPYKNEGAKPRPMTAKPPKIQKFVLEEDRGSPVLLIALGAIIVLAAGVILYSFKIL